VLSASLSFVSVVVSTNNAPLRRALIMKGLK
jgi:hypothetical protein